MCENQLQVEEVLQTESATNWTPPSAALEEGLSLIRLICKSLVTVWQKWPKDMKLSNVWNNLAGFTLSGECPHCHHDSAFMSVTEPYRQGDGDRQLLVGAARCVACNGFILGILKTVRVDLHHSRFDYHEHFPLGTPNDSVAPEVPAEIASDFREALRCRWVKSYKATVLMCRRSLQVSCDMEKAIGKDLFTQIDDLATKQRITEPLKKMAHRIRLLGKKGAHGDYSDIDDTITPNDADDAVKFMQHYLEHVYVLPAKLI